MFEFLNTNTGRMLQWGACIGALAGLAACAPPAVVFISRSYDPGRTHRVAVLNIRDNPNSPGSGEIAAATFEKYLLWAGYSLVERRQVSDVLSEQSLDVSGAIDQSTIRSVGKILGVDAVVLGNVTDFTTSREETVMVDMPMEQSDPVYGKVETVQQKGDTTIRTVQHVVTGYETRHTDQIVPQTETYPAHVGLSVRLVRVKTGEVLWSAQASSDGVDLTQATEGASSSIMQAIVKQLSKLQKG